jgi:hypothetical protein
MSMLHRLVIRLSLLIGAAEVPIGIVVDYLTNELMRMFGNECFKIRNLWVKHHHRIPRNEIRISSF